MDWSTDNSHVEVESCCEAKIPRIMLAAPSSGSGKTLITCGILQALVNRGLNVTSFKCGPDYIDPMFHSRIIGTNSRNIDTFFTDEETTRYLFGRTAKDSDISVVEGVMGFYDGLGGSSTEASSYDVSEKLNIPVILVLDCKGMSVSCIPSIKGFLDFRRNNIKGVILNNMSENIFNELKDSVEKELQIKVIGHVPNVKELVLESRHLGLVLPSEISDLKVKLNSLAEVLERTLDLNLLVDIANNVDDFEYNAPMIPTVGKRTRVAVAKDEAFCFIYEDNMELLERSGADIVYFSPLYDDGLPDNINGLIIPGGYPELHAGTLSSNRQMIDNIRSSIENGLPVLAECGGFMYLHDEMEDIDGKFHRMCGVVKGRAFNNGRLSRLGYATFTSEKENIIDTAIKGHEFHYWDSTSPGNDCIGTKTRGTTYECMHCNEQMAIGFPHLYYYSDPSFPVRFLKRCREFEKVKEKM